MSPASSIAALVTTLMLCSCGAPGTATTRVGAVCTTSGDCDSVCWQGSCTLACATAVDCPKEMTCIDPGVCAFSCVGDRECGGWQCAGERRYDEGGSVSVCVPRVGGDDPQDYDNDLQDSAPLP